MDAVTFKDMRKRLTSVTFIGDRHHEQARQVGVPNCNKGGHPIRYLLAAGLVFMLSLPAAAQDIQKGIYPRFRTFLRPMFVQKTPAQELLEMRSRRDEES